MTGRKYKGQRKTTRKTAALSAIHIHVRPQPRSQAWLGMGRRAIRAALGRAGVKAAKREGDGATPAGEFRPVRLWWRADRLARPRTLLPIRPIAPADAW